MIDFGLIHTYFMHRPGWTSPAVNQLNHSVCVLLLLAVEVICAGLPQFTVHVTYLLTAGIDIRKGHFQLGYSLSTARIFCPTSTHFNFKDVDLYL